MLVGWMVYAMLVAALLGLAGWALDRAVAARSAATRWIWLGALVGSVAAASTGAWPERVQTVTDPFEPTTSLTAPLPFVEAVRTLPSSTTLSPGSDIVAGGLWLTLSLLLCGALVRSFSSLEVARRGWERSVLDGRPVLVSERLGPAVVGILRSVIVVPRWALDLERADRELMLRHEEEHRRAGDTRLLLLGLLALVAMPWNLPLWWQVARLRLAVEIDCDRRVLRRESNLQRYGALLLEIGSRVPASRLSALAFARPVPFIERRIRAMTQQTRRRLLRSLALGALAGLLVVGSCQVDRPSITAPTSQSEATVVATDPLIVQVRVDESVITGTVNARETGEPVAGATVLVEDADMGGLTNIQGRFMLLNVPAGTHTVAVRHPELGDAIVEGIVIEAGARSVAREEPLIIVDGVITARVLADIEALDVESIEIVKGEQAQVVYGERGRNGVVQIKTRRGRAPLIEAPRPTPKGSGSVTGFVLHPDTGEPLPSVQIFFRELNMGGLSNNQGRFLLLNLPAGTHTLEFQHLELGSASVEVTITEGERLDAGRTTLKRQ